MGSYLVSALVCKDPAGASQTWGHRAVIISAVSRLEAKGVLLEKLIDEGYRIVDCSANILGEIPGYTKSNT